MSVCDPEGGMHRIWAGILPAQVFVPAPPAVFEPAYAQVLAEAVERHADELAAVIVEPVVQGAGGMRFHHPGYLKVLRKLCDEHGVLLVFDEIATGFGRSGTFFAMDLEENALTILEAAQGQPLAVQTDLLVQTLRALVYLHRHGIIHRDLKPGNVIVVADQVKVVDFGLSVFRDVVEMAGGECAGTFPYMAPEMLRGEPATHGADLYAFGVIAYELFTGAHLFAGDDPAAQYMHILNTPLPRATDDRQASESAKVLVGDRRQDGPAVN